MSLVDVWTQTDPERKGAWLDYFIVVTHALAAVSATVIGISSGSIALAGFGFANVVEAIVSGLRGRRNRLIARRYLTTEKQKRIERSALFILGIVFFLLSLSLLNEAGSRLFYRERPEPGILGIVVSALSLAALSIAAILKFRMAQRTSRPAIRLDARRCLLWSCLSALLLFGLWLHQVRGWWWADPVASLSMLPFLMREGWSTIEESKETRRGRQRT